MASPEIPGVKTFEFTKLIGIENMEFGQNVIIDDFVLIYAKQKIKIGSYVHIASFTSISGGGSFVMADFSGISSGCRIVTGSDDFKDWGFGNPSIANQFRNVSVGSVVMDKFSILGANSVVLPNVRIGEGVAVAANSLVTRDLDPWGIYVGNRRVGERNRDGVIANHEKFLTTPESERVGPLFRHT